MCQPHIESATALSDISRFSIEQLFRSYFSLCFMCRIHSELMMYNFCSYWDLFSVISWGMDVSNYQHRDTISIYHVEPHNATIELRTTLH